MKVSIFTPTHNSKYLEEVYESIKDQKFDEWVIVYNKGAVPVSFNDSRVKRINIHLEGGVGLMKSIACDNCTGDILVELDHDDLLTPNAIEEIRKAFEDESIGFVYSNAGICNMDFSKRERFNLAHGWEYVEEEFRGHMIDVPVSFEATPSSVSRIWYAPDHVRAFRRSVYDKVSGYDTSMRVLDDQDLMCRMYQVTKFHHINKMLYIYRVHGDNTWLERNKEIQDGVYPIYFKYIENMTLTWAKNNNLLCLDLGGRFNKDDRYTSVDIEDANILIDLETGWDFQDNSVGVVRANDVFEHLRNPLHTMKELYRVLAPGGYAFIRVPSTDGRGAFQDPTHLSYWNENSFLYYTDRYFSKYINTPVRFQVLSLFTTQKDERQVCWVDVHLMKLTDKKVAGMINI